MKLNYKSPIIIDFVPTPMSIITLKLKLKGSENGEKINIDINILYKDPSINERIFILNPGVQNIYTNTENRIYTLKFEIPEFKNSIISYLNIAIDDKYDKYKEIEKNEQDITIECLKISSTNSLEKEKILKKIISQKTSQDDEQDKPKQQDTGTTSPHATMVVPNIKPKAKESVWTLITTRIS